MSSNLPLRTIRIPALRQQCLFQRRRSLQLPRAFSTTAPQAFAATCLRLGRGSSQFSAERGAMKVASRVQQGYAPKVTEMKAQREGGLADDIGLLQDTIIRANWNQLPRPWERAFWAYMWKLTKSRVTALYSRSVYKRCIYHKGWARFLPIDNFAHKPIETTAKTLYQEVYTSFAQANMSPVSKFCLPPILENFETRIKARGPIEIDWKVLGGMKAKVVSHRASMFGEDQPDTAFRQVVVRITSRQSLENKFANNPVATGERKIAKGRAPGWVPLDVKKPETKPEAKAKSKPKTKAVTKNTETTKEVVEYFVLQKRVNRGVEDKQWKVWGFTQESTPERLEEDSEYWRKILSSTAGASG